MQNNPKLAMFCSLFSILAFLTASFGKKTDKELFIMGINHAELKGDRIIREWVLFDEVAIWKQILM